MSNENIAEQILKDFSLSNYDNLFKGETKCDQSVWFLIDKTKKRKSPYSLSNGEWKYSLTYNQNKKELWIESYKDILNKESKSKVLDLLQELDNKHDKICFERREKERSSFISKVFGVC